METITSRSNKWIKCALRVQKKKYRDEYGLFLVEGVRSVEDVARGGIQNAVCFIAESKRETPFIQGFIKTVKTLHWLILVVADSLLMKVCETQNGQGIAALVSKPSHRDIEKMNPYQGTFVFLDTVQDPGNVGTIIRTAAAAGCAAVFLSEGCADPYSDKVVRSSMGSLFRIPVYEIVDAKILKNKFEKESIPFVGTSLVKGKSYKTIEHKGSRVFVFGNEGNGLSAEVEALCDSYIYIPMSHDVESLNVSVAAGIILFHYL